MITLVGHYVYKYLQKSMEKDIILAICVIIMTISCHMAILLAVVKDYL